MEGMMMCVHEAHIGPEQEQGPSRYSLLRPYASLSLASPQLPHPH